MFDNKEDLAKALNLAKISKDSAEAALSCSRFSNQAKEITSLLDDTGSKTISDLGLAFEGLGTIIKAHPIATIGTAAVTGITLAYGAYKNYKQNLIDSSDQITASWQNQNSTLELQKQQYADLKGLLDSGVLDETQTYDVKMKILDIQNQIVSAYGSAASELDLVNGNLETQLSLIGQISVKEAQKNLNSHRTEYKDAETEMNKDRHYYLGDTGINPEAGGIGKSIYDLAKSYENQGISLQDDGTGIYTIHFNGDATQAEETINSFMTDTNELMDKYKNDESASNYLDNILSFSEKGLKKNQETLDNYQENYKSFLQMDMIAQGNEEGSPADIYNDYTEAVSRYNQAVAEGDSGKIEEATSALLTAQDARDAFLDGDGEKYGLLFDDII